MRPSILRNLKHSSPLKSMKQVRGGGATGKEKSLFFSLNLTTLIDAFCILVIFLLSNMNGRVQNLQENQKIVLPVAVASDVLDQGLVIRIEGNGFFVDDKATSDTDLAQALLEAKKSVIQSLIIQADRNVNYENIARVLRAGGQAGFEKYVFAVMPGI